MIYAAELRAGEWAVAEEWLSAAVLTPHGGSLRGGHRPCGGPWTGTAMQAAEILSISVQRVELQGDSRVRHLQRGGKEQG